MICIVEIVVLRRVGQKELKESFSYILIRLMIGTRLYRRRDVQSLTPIYTRNQVKYLTFNPVKMGKRYLTNDWIKPFRISLTKLDP